ncbi:SCO2522 family protein [Actinokineospora sp. NPDC004072]
MSTLDSPVYTEAAARPEPRQVALSHLSVEVGHFYMEDLLGGPERVRAQFRRVAPWLAAAREAQAAELGGIKPRISTCFLIDDYFRADTDPAAVIPLLLDSAAECGVQIDYLAREAGCHEADRVPLAEITAAMLLPEPPVGTTGSRPPVQDSGWLCNGERSPDSTGRQAMLPAVAWAPPEEFGKRNHSIFLDVELWKDHAVSVDGVRRVERKWSCPFLAAVWQLIRLGQLRHAGEPVAQPQPWSGPWPRHWRDLPAVIQLSERPHPFSAYRTSSILPKPYLKIEDAVNVILDHLDLDDAVVAQTARRAEAEGLHLPAQLSDRVAHVFIEAAAGRSW